MNKLVLATMIMGAIGGSAFANGVVTGPVEPNTQAPVVSGYNSVACSSRCKYSSYRHKHNCSWPL